MDITYDKTNESAYKYQESVHDRVADICEPLNQYFGINVFIYTKVFFDGRYFVTSNQLKFSKFDLQYAIEDVGLSNISDIHSTPLTARNSDPFGQVTPFLWPSVPNSQVSQALYDYGLWHGFTMAKMSPEWTEFWSFLNNRDSDPFQEKYICHQEVLSTFIRFFNTCAADIVTCDERDIHKIGFYKNAHKLPHELPGCEEDITVNAFLEELRKKSKYLHKIKPEFT